MAMSNVPEQYDIENWTRRLWLLLIGNSYELYDDAVIFSVATDFFTTTAHCGEAEIILSTSHRYAKSISTFHKLYSIFCWWDLSNEQKLIKRCQIKLSF